MLENMTDLHRFSEIEIKIRFFNFLKSTLNEIKNLFFR